jgi:hypothetical protein
MKPIYLIKRLITSNHVILPCSQLYTPISVFPDATLQKILGPKPILWELNNIGHSLRQSQIIVIVIICYEL